MADLATTQNAPWGGKQYGDPGKFNPNQDYTTQQGIMSSPIYAQFKQALLANRMKTQAGTQAQLGTQTPQMDPFAAQRENSQLGLEAQIGHGNYMDQNRALENENNLKLRNYLEDLQRNDLEEARRNEYWDKAGRTAYGGGQLIASLYSGGAAKGKKAKKNEDALSGKDDQYSGPSGRSGPGTEGDIY